MPTVKLPVFAQNVPTRSLMRDMTLQQARGALVKSGIAYHAVPLDDVYKALGRKEITLTVSNFSRVTPLSVAGRMGLVLPGIAGAHFRMAAPLYACPYGDQSSTTASTCSAHLVPMVKVSDGEE